ncbi:protein PHR1-LIKE 1-like isoform X3 [Tripterygium wilfordii]|uniref:Protein PHR1-LIKE 1-like isoform X3 n=1 Tax=Tripterygium wilfordii TaxID=458696 RepID=A0A7J7CTL4_TRIWF|nr:protein PHR1-LIKE 1-like isoform X3 [Tripterygium wilfordii]
MNNNHNVYCQVQIQRKAGLEFSDIGLQQSFNMGISQQNKNLQPTKPSTPILSRFESPPVSAFYGTEWFMEFPQYMNTCAQTHSSNYSSRESSFIESTEQAQLQSKDTLQSFVKCHCYGHQNKNCSQKSSKIPYRNINPGDKFLQFQRGRLLEGDASVTGKQLTVPSEGFQANIKYRTAKYMLDSTEGKSEKTRSTNDSLKLDVKSGLQIKEALQLQVDVQRQLHEQLEVQRNLQLRIEEQGRKLQMMFELQHKQKSLLSAQDSDIVSSPADLPFSIQDDEVSVVKGSQNTQFPSKIS